MQYFFVFNQAFYCSKQNIRFPLASVPSSSPSRLRSKRFHRLSLIPSPSTQPPLQAPPFSLSPFRNPFRHHIQFQALFPSNSLFLHMILPRANLKQQPLRAGIKALTARLIQPRETILPQEHDTIPPVHCLAQNLC